MALDEELDLPRPFGPYTLVRRLAVGGMAEVYVAKTKGFGGFEKVVAIKVIHPRYSEDDHFIQMLVEEAKISVLLNHVNIAQTFDLGCIDDTYYIVMELIEGADAYRVMRKASEMKVALPIDLAAFIAAEMCNGLDYAHRKRDPEGKPLGIVHRDISPQNVLISFAGEVKVVDFGIAKAALRSNQTEAGVIKGKYYYMSPEQAWGDPMDHRSDIFSAGVVLYELLTGRMLYTEENVPLLLDKVRKAEITPPEARRPSVPRALSQIVMRALAKEPIDRYQSAGELQNALMQFVYASSPTFTASRLAELMGTLFPSEVQRHSAIVKLPSVEEPLERSPERDMLAPEVHEKSVIFDLGEDDEDMTRNDVLPFRKALAARGTKPIAAGLDGAPRPTFRPPRMRISDVPEETTAPGRRPPAGTDKITAPKVRSDGAWVAPVPVDAVTTNPKCAAEDVTDDTHAQAEWDDPTKLKDGDRRGGGADDWESDQTLVDTEGLSAAVDAMRKATASKAAAVQSERGKVNVQNVAAPKAPQRPPAHLGRSAVRPLAPGAKPPSVPPPPASQAWDRAQARKIPSAPALPAVQPSGPPRRSLPPPSVPPTALPPHALPPPPGAQQLPRSPGAPALPPQAVSLEAVPRPREEPTAALGDRGTVGGDRAVGLAGPAHPGPAFPASPFVTPAHLRAPGAVVPAPSLDPFAPPPPRPADVSGGFERAPAAATSRRTMAIVLATVAAAGLTLSALAAALTSGPPPAIEIVSAPTGAQVSVGGRAVGTAPVTVTEGLEAGRPVRVDVTMAGYQPWTAELAPEDGTLRQFVVLAPLQATLRVETDPPGAQVTVGGVLRGPSPVDVTTGLTVGQDVAVTATIPGRPPVVRQVRLSGGTTTERILISP